MKKSRQKRVLALAFAAMAALSGCGSSHQNNSQTATAAENQTMQAVNSSIKAAEWKEEDLDTSAENGISIVGNGSSVEISGDGASEKSGNVTITKAGTYVLSGSFKGQIMVDAASKDLIHLVLQGVDITCESSAAIFGSQSDKIVITLAEGTVNTVTDGSTYLYESAEEDEPNSAIFSKDDLTINGTGTLIVKGNYEDGIRTKDDLKIVSGIYEITAVKDAIQGKDSLCIQDGNFTIKAGNDAVKASNDTDAEKGYVIIDGGAFFIDAEDDAFHAETYMIINGGNIDITSCYEGIEGLNVEINGGMISLYAADDGINAAGGSDEGESFFGGGQMGGNSSAWITINGGTIYVSADGDGIDSNGNLYVNGGTIYVEGPENGGNGALDYDGMAIVKGGSILAVGSSQMAQGFSSDSTQGHIFYHLSEWQNAGSEVTITDSQGTELYSYTPSKGYNCLVLSMPELKADETYTITCGSVSEEITLSGGSYKNSSSAGGRGGGGGMNRENRPDMEAMPFQTDKGNTEGENGNAGRPRGRRQEASGQETVIP